MRPTVCPGLRATVGKSRIWTGSGPGRGGGEDREAASPLPSPRGRVSALELPS